MTFSIFGIDFYLKYKLFGFWLLSFKSENPRSLFGIYWSNGTLIFNFFWFNFEF